MKSRNLIIVLIVLLVVLNGAYFLAYPGKIKNSDKNGEPKVFGEITLKSGEEGEVAGLVIKMLRIKDDSRCPINARCVWAGKVSADVELKSREITGVTTLDSGNSPHLFENYLIKLIDVKPGKVAGQEITQAEYSATFYVDSAEGGGIKKIEDDVISESAGIKGFVVIGPICPVQRAGDDSCNDKPVKTNIVIKDKKKDVIKSFETLEDGSFLVDLSPGNYVIYADSGNNTLGGSKPEYVTVEDGKFSEVTIRIDTGIR